MDFARFTTISFDCYGTLIDWEAGILPVLRELLARHDRSLGDSEILELYGEFEAEAETDPYRSYREVLQSVVANFGKGLGFTPSSSEIDSLAASVPLWPPFADTVAALQQLGRHYRLVIISNIDDALFVETRKLLPGVQFADVITAQQARSYKPSLNNFKLAMERLSIPPEQLLHAAQSVYHDVVPARSLGIASVWVNRKSARPGVGAVRAAAGKPDLEVPDLATLAARATAG